MKRLPIRLPPILYILIFNQFHLANVINGIGMSIFAVDRFGAGDLAVGSLGAVMLFAYGSVAWMGGLLADRHPKRVLIPLGLGALAVAFASVPYVRTFGQLVALAGFCSLIFVTIMPSHFGLIAESVRYERVSRYLGFNAMVLVFAGMAAAFFVGRLYAAGGPELTWRSAASISFCALVFVVLCAPRNENAAAPCEPQPIPTPGPARRFRPIAVPRSTPGLAASSPPAWRSISLASSSASGTSSSSSASPRCPNWP
jgi:MFS family permease